LPDSSFTIAAASKLPKKIPEQLVRETYEKKALSWDEDINRAEKEFLAPKHIKLIFDKFYAQSKDLAILDLGCGTGLCGDFLHAQAKELVGVDLSQHMLNIATNKGQYTYFLKITKLLNI